jgi:hypothetical protein
MLIPHARRTPLPTGRQGRTMKTVSPSPLMGEGRGEGGISWVSSSPQSSLPAGGEGVFGVIF